MRVCVGIYACIYAYMFMNTFSFVLTYLAFFLVITSSWSLTTQERTNLFFFTDIQGSLLKQHLSELTFRIQNTDTHNLASLKVTLSLNLKTSSHWPISSRQISQSSSSVVPHGPIRIYLHTKTTLYWSKPPHTISQSPLMIYLNGPITSKQKGAEVAMSSSLRSGLVLESRFKKEQGKKREKRIFSSSKDSEDRATKVPLLGNFCAFLLVFAVWPSSIFSS